MSKLRSSAYLICANLLAAAIQFVSIPLYIRWFGKEGYAAYLYVVAIWGYVALLCPDYTTGAQKRITENIAKGRHDLAVGVQQAQCAGTLINATLAIALAFGFSLIFHLPGHSVPVFPLVAAFLLIALGFGLRALTGIANALLAATERFGPIAIRQSAETLVAAIAALTIAYFTRSPLALLVGSAIGAAVGLGVSFVVMRRLAADYPLLPKWNGKTLGDLLLLSIKAFPHSIVNQMASGLDRVLMPFGGLKLASVTDYGVPYRLPETLSGMLAPAIDTVVPDLTRKSATDTHGFAKAIDKYGLQSLAVAAALILVPSGWGGPFLRIWLGTHAPVGGALVVLLIGLYFCLNFYFSTLTRAFRATGEMHYVVPFSGLNAVATLVFTIPAARWGGIVGVAAMNAIINVVQIAPFAFYMKLAAARQFPAAAHALKAMALVALGSGLAVGAYAIGQTAPLLSNPWLCFAFGPVWVIVAGTAFCLLRLMPIPEGLRRFMPSRLRG